MLEEKVRYRWKDGGKTYSLIGDVINDTSAIKNEVKSVTGVDPLEKGRKKELISPRTIYLFLCATCSRKSLVSIAKESGFANHSNVIHHRNTAMAYIEAQKERLFLSDLKKVMELIGVKLKIR